MRRHLHLGSETWELKIDDAQETLRGTLEERLVKAYDKTLFQSVGVTADPDVPMQVLLMIAGHSRGASIQLDAFKTKEQALAPAEGIGLPSSGSLEGLGDSTNTSPGKVRMGAVAANGRLPPEVIQRIVRQNFGRFRLCYEEGLKRNPKLEGRVAVKFVIGRDGGVTHVTNSGSDLPDEAVVACVLNAFRGLAFPQPEGGIVTVSYPLVFTP